MADASAGIPGALSAAGMRALPKAAGEIDAMVVNTAMHLKALTGRSGGSKHPLGSWPEPAITCGGCQGWWCLRWGGVRCRDPEYG